MKKNAAELIDNLNTVKDSLELALEKYVDEYSEYGADSIANSYISIIAKIEALRLTLKSEEVSHFDIP